MPIRSLPACWSTLRPLLLEYWSKLRAGIMTLEFWIGAWLFGTACLGVLFLTLYIQGVQEDQLFYREGVTAKGRIVSEWACGRSGYCYQIRYTTRDGREVTFEDSGLERYATGFVLVNNVKTVEYLPDQPTRARLYGTQAAEGVYLFLALGCLGLVVIVVWQGIKLHFWRKVNDGFQQQLAALLAEQRFDEAVEFVLTRPDRHREDLLVTLVMRFYELKEIRRAQELLAHPEVSERSRELVSAWKSYRPELWS